MKEILSKIVKRHIILLAIICLYFCLVWLFELKCPFLLVFKIPCPTCGVTRAVLALFRLDFTAYLEYQPMALFLCAAVLLMINLDLVKHKRAVIVYSVSTAAVNFILYLLRLIFFT